ncbi:hypothetical protein [Dankookia sp. P2]|uniref:hypothetical protein n=1 Tax=Dankookia sp. P2 TaxID=3423955 RepID=UPI003D67DF7E
MDTLGQPGLGARDVAGIVRALVAVHVGDQDGAEEEYQHQGDGDPLDRQGDGLGGGQGGQAGGGAHGGWILAAAVGRGRWPGVWPGRLAGLLARHAPKATCILHRFARKLWAGSGMMVANRQA